MVYFSMVLNMITQKNYRFYLFFLLNAICALVLSGCALFPSKTDMFARSFEGKNIEEVYAVFGEPNWIWDVESYDSYKSSYPTATKNYTWNKYSVTGYRDAFVQTGTEYTGSQLIGVTQGGQGVASAPIYQDNYRPTGYYQKEEVVSGCVIKMLTDDKGTILRGWALFGDQCDSD